MFTSFKADGSADKTKVFAEGWLDNHSRQYRGRPVDVANLPDGSIFVSNDFADALYSISYAGPQTSWVHGLAFVYNTKAKIIHNEKRGRRWCLFLQPALAARTQATQLWVSQERPCVQHAMGR